MLHPWRHKILSGPGARRLAAVLSALTRPGALIAFVVAGLAWFVWNYYYLKPYSDPLNWLTLAHNLHPTDHLQRFPLAYPVFLRFVIRLVGPFYVFVSNLPLLVAIVLLVARLTVLAARECMDARAAAYAGVAAAAGLLYFDSEILVYLTNPYRDPLSHVLLLTSVLLLIAYLGRGGRPWIALVLSALALGLATDVRETAVLMAPVMGWYGLSAWRKNRAIPLGRSVILFGAFLALGVLPLVLQSYFRTGHAVVPPQAVVEGRLLPGLHLRAFVPTLIHALRYFWWRGGWLYAAGLVYGIGLAVVRRRSLLRDLLLPAALVHFIFYCFYWVFVKRYFFIVVLWSVPLAACGALALAERLLCAAGKQRWILPALRSLAALFVLVAVIPLLRPPEMPPFQIPQARRLKADIEKAVPRDAVILTPPGLGGLVSYFTRLEAYAIPILNPTNLEVEIHQHVRERLAAGHPLYLMDSTDDPFGRIVRQLFDTETMARAPADRYHFQPAVGLGDLALSRLSLWTNTATSLTLEAAPDADDILLFNGATLWLEGVPRRWARLSLNGRVIAPRVGNGTQYYRVDWPSFTPPYRLTLESDQPVPNTFGAGLVRRDEPLVLRFASSGDTVHDAVLEEGFTILKGQTRRKPHWPARATVAVPMPYPPNDLIQVSFYLRVRPTTKESLEVPVDVRFTPDGQPPETRRILRSYIFHRRVLRIPAGAREGQVCRIGLETLDVMSGAPEPPFPPELDRITVHDLSAIRSVDIGSGVDFPHIVSGFYAREGRGEDTMRWTDGKGVLAFWLAADGTDRVVRVDFKPQIRATNAPPAEIALSFNGTDLAAHLVDSNRVEAAIPATLVQPGTNTLTVSSTTWSPHELLGVGDSRQLGIPVDRVGFYSEPK
ncbi:MAG TPA: hypothetical protein P5567_01150 [Kiritimatiellia bacterium]|nr:hypothetical protein [Kiritimatiellia bacterium]HRZ11041.1 hypothetical protein [Kiritimatiellia bacterium]HSA18614.1 hypothetical protein [Kiritimatiellia bacterium]